MTSVWVIIAAFFCGSLPFSYWIGRYLLRKDIRAYGDGNPGATNVLLAGGKKWGAMAALFDGLKGAIPVGLAYFAAEFSAIELIVIALAPILGHGFSPFLKFRGGKAVAVTFGVWAGLTLWEIPTVMGLLLGFWFTFIAVSGWALLYTLISTLIYLVFAHPDPTLIIIFLFNGLLLGWKYRSDLMQMPKFRPWYRNMKLLWHS